MSDLKARFAPRDAAAPAEGDKATTDIDLGALKIDDADQKTESKEEPTDATKEESSESKPAEQAEQAEQPTEDDKQEAEDMRSQLIESSYDVQVKLADLQADPNSPLYSVKSFKDLGLSEELLKGLSMMKFMKPSKIQERALPLLLKNPPQNFIGQSQSGTGKTGAFTLTMLSRVDLDKKQPQCVCLCPSRELAIQSAEVAKTMAKYTSISIEVIVAADEEDKKQRRGPSRRSEPPVTSQVLIGTPGRFQSLAKKGLLDLSSIKVLVLDEADNMLETNLAPQVTLLKNQMPASTQIVLFSATFPDEVYAFAKSFVPNSNEIRLQQNELNVSGIKQLYMDCADEQDKISKLVHLYSVMTIGSSIIFVRTKRSAELLYQSMTKMGHKVSLLHGDLRPQDRDQLMADYRAGKNKVLITTNVLARGVDVASVSVVVNYDLPVDKEGKPDPSTYLHRIGRTGRFGRVGVSISFVHDEASFKTLTAIEDYFKGSIRLTNLPTDDWAEVEEIVRKAIKN